MTRRRLLDGNYGAVRRHRRLFLIGITERL
jgi:hypothetical protein